MVKETRIIFGLDDLHTVRVRCMRCKGALTQKINAAEILPDTCPLCHSDWRGQAAEHQRDLLAQMRRVLASTGSPIEMQLEIDGALAESD